MLLGCLIHILTYLKTTENMYLKICIEIHVIEKIYKNMLCCVRASVTNMALDFCILFFVFFFCWENIFVLSCVCFVVFERV